MLISSYTLPALSNTQFLEEKFEFGLTALSTIKMSSVKNITNNVKTRDPIGSKNRNCPYRELGILSLPEKDPCEHSTYLAAVM